ncbi:MAG TPA: hypothetical protein VNY05_33865 [Candidatus Acidoferrales bacterium]|nr:hypothetical protein [Candidatus Acidoferrales bacterium]
MLEQPVGLGAVRLIGHHDDIVAGAVRSCQEFGNPIPEPGSNVPLVVPTGIRDRSSAVAEKRHVRPEELGSELIAEALAKETAA